MFLTPTILIGITKKRMNRLIHSKNEIYYYVIGESLRKRLATLFDALGNIASYNDYYCLMKKYTDLKPFSTCNCAELLQYRLSQKEGIVIAIDRITKDLYLPSKIECKQFSLNLHYPQLLPPHGDYVKDIMDEHFNSIKPKMNRVIKEIEQQTFLYKKQMNRVLEELITRPKIYKEKMDLVMNELQYTHVHNLMKEEIDTLLKQIALEVKLKEPLDNGEESIYKLIPSFGNEYEYEFDFEKDIELETIEEEIEESLESVIADLKEVMTMSKQHLPNRLENSLPSLVQFIENEVPFDEFPLLNLRIEVDNDEILVDESQLQAEVEEALAEEDMDALLKELHNDDELDSEIEARFEAELSKEATFPVFDVEVEQISATKQDAEVEQISATKQDAEVEQEIDAEIKEEIEKEEPKEDVVQPKEEPKEGVVQPKEEPKEDVVQPKEEEDNLDDIDVIELDSKEFQEPMKSSTLVSDLFQKLNEQTKAPAAPETPEVPKAAKSYLGSMWSYLGWRS